MKKTTTRLISVFALLCLLLSATGCGDFEARVPTSVIMMLVEESEYYDGYSGLSVTESHDFDEDTNMDTVQIKMAYAGEYGEYYSRCTARYAYDRSSDLWSLAKAGEWSKIEYKFNDNLIREWTLSYHDDTYTIEITDVTNGKIQLDYTVVIRGDVNLQTSGSVTVAAGEYSYINVPVQLPSGYYVSSGFQNKGTEANLLVNLDIAKGVTSGMMLDYIVQSSS